MRAVGILSFGYLMLSQIVHGNRDCEGSLGCSDTNGVVALFEVLH